MESAPRDNLVELEIAAFMGPHIKRARIVLVAIGLLYAIFGFMSYRDLAPLREMVDQWKGVSGDDPQFLAIERQVSLLHIAIIVLISAGIANIGLAILAGKKTMLAFYIAIGIFIVTSAIQLYFSGGALLTNFLWWITLFCLGMGFQAALKAERLRVRGSSAL